MQDFSKYKNDYDAADGLPEGVYTAVVTEVKLRDTNQGDEMIDVSYQVTEGQFSGHKDKYTLWLFSSKSGQANKVSLSNIKEIVGYMGQPTADINATMNTFLNDLVGNQVALQVKQNGKYKNVDITSVEGKVLGVATPAPAASVDTLPF